MKSILFIFIFSISLIASNSIKEVSYESGISIYGQIGFVDLILEENLQEKTYKITAKTTSIGLVKVLSSNRIDVFTSEGTIEKGVYKPKKFTRYTSKSDYEKTRKYIFDYANNTVIKTEIIAELETTSEFNPLSMSFTTTEEIVTKEEIKNIDLHKNDFLSLYLNLMHGNLVYGKVPYVDMKEKDGLFFIEDNLFEVHKNHGEDKYKIKMLDDEKSIFFKEVTSVGIAFYGDAYIKKVSESN